MGSASHGAAAVIAGVLVAFVFNVALFMSAFKILTAIDLSWRELLPGVIVAAVSWQALQHLAGFYLGHELKRTGPLYGLFAAVLGLLAWLYLGAQLTMFAAEINVVRARKLWPRSLFGDPVLEADRRAHTEAAEAQERSRLLSSAAFPRTAATSAAEREWNRSSCAVAGSRACAFAAAS